MQVSSTGIRAIIYDIQEEKTKIISIRKNQNLTTKIKLDL